MKSDLSKTPLKEVSDDPSLSVCWKGQKPFKSVNDVKQYFKTLALSFVNAKRTLLEVPPENYLIITVSITTLSLPLSVTGQSRQERLNCGTLLFLIAETWQCVLGNSRRHRSRTRKSQCHRRYMTRKHGCHHELHVLRPIDFDELVGCSQTSLCKTSRWFTTTRGSRSDGSVRLVIGLPSLELLPPHDDLLAFTSMCVHQKGDS